MNAHFYPTLAQAVILALLVLCGACSSVKLDYGLPDRDTIAKGKPLPIDGIWELVPDFNGLTGEKHKVRIEKGRVFILDSPSLKTGIVLVKDLTPLDETRYNGTRLVGKGDGYYQTKTTFDVVSPTEMLEHIEKFDGGAMLFYDFRLTNVSLLNKESFLDAHGTTEAKAEITPNAIEIENLTEEKVEISTQEQYVDPGAKLTIERSRTIEHCVTLSSDYSLEGFAKINVLKFIEASIRNKLEKRLSQTFKESETYRVSVELDGSKAQKWKLVWFDKVKKGVAKYTDKEGKAHPLHFRFPLDSTLEAISVK